MVGVVGVWWLKPILVFSLAQAEQFHQQDICSLDHNSFIKKQTLPLCVKCHARAQCGNGEGGGDIMSRIFIMTHVSNNCCCCLKGPFDIFRKSLEECLIVSPPPKWALLPIFINHLILYCYR